MENYILIGKLDFYMPNKVAQIEGENKVKEIINQNCPIIQEVGCYDWVYGELRFTGKHAITGNNVYIHWNYFNHEILAKFL